MSTPTQEPVILYEAQVVSVDDEFAGRRIKARMLADKCSDEDLPWAFPLMPKMINVMPKVGEMVLLQCSKIDPYSNRFYIGPVISQYQCMQDEQFMNGRGTSDYLFSDRTEDSAQESIDNYEITRGAFPKIGSVGLIGREGEDITLNEGDVTIRAGARIDVSDDYDALQGKVGFDRNNTAFIKLQKDDNCINVMHTKDHDATHSVCSIGADKIYLISRHEQNVDSALEEYDPDTLIPEDKIQQLQDAMHEVPYGDILVECLKNIKTAIVNHTHPWADLPPYKAFGVDKVVDDDYEKILSPNVFTS